MSEMNVVPLMGVLLVLLVIFMIIPHWQTGLKAEIPQPAPPGPPKRIEPDIVVIQVLDGGSLKINEQAVTWEALRSRLEEIFRSRANHAAFVR
jgi:biopolymer transport protein ExbD